MKGNVGYRILYDHRGSLARIAQIKVRRRKHSIHIRLGETKLRHGHQSRSKG